MADFTFPVLIYLPDTLPIPNGDEKLNLILILNRFGYPRSSPSLHWIKFFNKKYKFFCNSLEKCFLKKPLKKCCNALSNNMFTLTFVRPIDLIAPLNTKGSFYNTTIIKQNNMTYHYKVIFCIRDKFGVCTYILVTRPIPVFWNRENPNSNPVKKGENRSNWIWVRRVTTGMGFVVMTA